MSVPDLPSPASSMPSLVRCRGLARLLLASVRSDDPARARPAAERLRRLQSFAALGADELLAALRADSTRVRLKHALALVAVELGFASWPELKAACAQRDAAVAADASLGPEAMYAPGMGLYLNRWFANYDEARASLDVEGGFLLPYRHQFFVASAQAVAELGLDPDDPDWSRIGFDWVRPADHSAHARLVARRRAVIG